MRGNTDIFYRVNCVCGVCLVMVSGECITVNDGGGSDVAVTTQFHAASFVTLHLLTQWL